MKDAGSHTAPVPAKPPNKDGLERSGSEGKPQTATKGETLDTAKGEPKAAPTNKLSDNILLVDRGILLCRCRQRLERVAPLAMECRGVDHHRCHLLVRL